MGSILDLLYRLTEWLREATTLPEFSLWVTDWPLAIWLQEHFLAIPGFRHAKSHEPQELGVHLARIGVVLDDEDQRRTSNRINRIVRHTYPAAPGQPPPKDRAPCTAGRR